MLTNVTELATELFQKKGVCYYLTRLIAFKNTSNQVWSEQPKELPLVSGLPNTRISLIKNSSLLRGYCSHDKGHFFIIHFLKINSFKRQVHKMVKHIQTIRRQKAANCLSVFDHFVELALKGLIKPYTYWRV